MICRPAGSAIVVVVLACLTACEIAAPPPVTIGAVTLGRSELVPERYQLDVALFNASDLPLSGYRVRGTAFGASSASGATEGSGGDRSRPGIPVTVSTVIDLAPRSRDVHHIVFDSPFPALSATPLTLEDVVFDRFRFPGETGFGSVALSYPVVGQ